MQVHTPAVMTRSPESRAPGALEAAGMKWNPPFRGVHVGAPDGVGHDAGVRLDHISYAVSNNELSDTIQRLGSLLQGTFQDGGRHPRFGTRNFILPLGDGAYIEVVSPLDHPATDSAPFGRAVRDRVQDGGGWLGWVLSTDDLSPIEKRVGRTAVEGHRVRPDGYDLRWRQIGVLDLMADPQLPFFIEWLTPRDERPSAGGNNLTLEAIEICGDPDRIEEWLGAPLHTALAGVQIRWVNDDPDERPGLVAAHIGTTHGLIRID